ncbi:unnamed protein product, partial [Ectocarpus sp. 12 AP-2014]
VFVTALGETVPTPTFLVPLLFLLWCTRALKSVQGVHGIQFIVAFIYHHALKRLENILVSACMIPPVLLDPRGRGVLNNISNRYSRCKTGRPGCRVYIPVCCPTIPSMPFGLQLLLLASRSPRCTAAQVVVASITHPSGQQRRNT